MTGVAWTCLTLSDLDRNASPCHVTPNLTGPSTPNLTGPRPPGHAQPALPYRDRLAPRCLDTPRLTGTDTGQTIASVSSATGAAFGFNLHGGALIVKWTLGIDRRDLERPQRAAIVLGRIERRAATARARGYIRHHADNIRRQPGHVLLDPLRKRRLRVRTAFWSLWHDEGCTPVISRPRDVAKHICEAEMGIEADFDDFRAIFARFIVQVDHQSCFREMNEYPVAHQVDTLSFSPFDYLLFEIGGIRKQAMPVFDLEQARLHRLVLLEVDRVSRPVLRRRLAIRATDLISPGQHIRIGIADVAGEIHAPLERVGELPRIVHVRQLLDHAQRDPILAHQFTAPHEGIEVEYRLAVDDGLPIVLQAALDDDRVETAHLVDAHVRVPRMRLPGEPKGNTVRDTGETVGHGDRKLLPVDVGEPQLSIEERLAQIPGNRAIPFLGHIPGRDRRADNLGDMVGFHAGGGVRRDETALLRILNPAGAGRAYIDPFVDRRVVDLALIVDAAVRKVLRKVRFLGAVRAPRIERELRTLLIPKVYVRIGNVGRRQHDAVADARCRHALIDLGDFLEGDLLHLIDCFDVHRAAFRGDLARRPEEQEIRPAHDARQHVAFANPNNRLAIGRQAGRQFSVGVRDRTQHAHEAPLRFVSRGRLVGQEHPDHDRFPFQGHVNVGKHFPDRGTHLGALHQHQRFALRFLGGCGDCLIQRPEAWSVREVEGFAIDLESFPRQGLDPLEESLINRYQPNVSAGEYLRFIRQQIKSADKRIEHSEPVGPRRLFVGGQL